METRPLVRADLITGVILLVFGLAVTVEAYNMPRLEERFINPWTVPGIVPGMLGITIAILGGVLALRSVLAGAFSMKVTETPAEAAERRSSLFRLLLCGVLCLFYAIVLVGRVPFWLATGLFVFLFIATFEWARFDDTATRIRKLATAAAIAVGAAAVIPFMFEYLFLVRLP